MRADQPGGTDAMASCALTSTARQAPSQRMKKGLCSTRQKNNQNKRPKQRRPPIKEPRDGISVAPKSKFLAYRNLPFMLLKLIRTMWGAPGAEDPQQWDTLFAKIKAEGFYGIEAAEGMWLVSVCGLRRKTIENALRLVVF